IDITKAHIQFAQQIAAERKLSDRIKFVKMDACELKFDPESFSYAIAIEGPAHFNSREEFLKQVYLVLEPKGVLLLSDIIVNTKVAQKNLFNRWLSKLCAKHWLMPRENWMTLEEFEKMLKDIGYDCISVRGVGENVYLGFARFNLKLSSIVNAMRIRGPRLGIGLTFISWLLGFLYRRGIIDYTLVRAVKRPAASLNEGACPANSPPSA
ncbi:MAG TPA: methyltransferase domain-containing protein, partial [Desulfobaccales bacterium]|nr:methyltransferase domain-containing protein [Desulfobaccales bacterium]